MTLFFTMSQPWAVIESITGDIKFTYVEEREAKDKATYLNDLVKESKYRQVYFWDYYEEFPANRVPPGNTEDLVEGVDKKTHEIDVPALPQERRARKIWHVAFMQKMAQAKDVFQDDPVVETVGGGFVRLIDWMGSDLSVVRAARVSYNADWRQPKAKGENHDAKLINYLMVNDHTSPFEAVTFTFEVKAPILVFRQWHRHRTQSYNEMSARYTELEEGYYVPRPEHIGTKSKSSKQGRVILPECDADHNVVWEKQAHDVLSVATVAADAYYRQLISMGVPLEVARMVLPVSTFSRMFVTMNLLNLFKYLKLRLHEHAQFEIRESTKALRDLAWEIVPVSAAAWDAHNGYASFTDI